MLQTERNILSSYFLTIIFLNSSEVKFKKMIVRKAEHRRINAFEL